MRIDDSWFERMCLSKAGRRSVPILSRFRLLLPLALPIRWNRGAEHRNPHRPTGRDGRGSRSSSLGSRPGRVLGGLITGMDSAGKDRRPRRRILAIAAGLVVGIAASQLLPAAGMFVEVLSDVGVERTVAKLVVAVLFAIGGIEGSLLVGPLVEQIRANRKLR